MAKKTTVDFSNGFEMPILGLGTYKACKDLRQLVCDAIDVGYRHIDCALVYGNESEIGNAIQQKIAEKVVERKELFITSKLWTTFMRPDLVELSLKQSLNDLRLDYLDLYLIHWPMAFQENNGFYPKDENGKIIASDADYLDSWKVMEDCVAKGLIRSIGISNFNSQQLDRLMQVCTIKPVTNQVELHAYFPQKQLRELCAKWGIILTAYGPLARPGNLKSPNDPVLINDPLIKTMAEKYDRTPAQIALRYLTMQGIPVIPKTSSKRRLIENLDSIEFDLTAEDMKSLHVLNNVNYRNGFYLETNTHPQYPFNIPF